MHFEMATWLNTFFTPKQGLYLLVINIVNSRPLDRCSADCVLNIIVITYNLAGLREPFTRRQLEICELTQFTHVLGGG